MIFQIEPVIGHHRYSQRRIAIGRQPISLADGTTKFSKVEFLLEGAALPVHETLRRLAGSDLEFHPNLVHAMIVVNGYLDWDFHIGSDRGSNSRQTTLNSWSLVQRYIDRYHMGLFVNDPVRIAQEKLQRRPLPQKRNFVFKGVTVASDRFHR